jgi:hypothetical protein
MTRMDGDQEPGNAALDGRLGNQSHQSIHNLSAIERRVADGQTRRFRNAMIVPDQFVDVRRKHSPHRHAQRTMLDEAERPNNLPADPRDKHASRRQEVISGQPHGQTALRNEPSAAVGLIQAAKGAFKLVVVNCPRKTDFARIHCVPCHVGTSTHRNAALGASKPIPFGNS